jgi:hypothetical protein
LAQFKSSNEDSIKYEDTGIEPLQSYITNKTDVLEDVSKKGEEYYFIEVYKTKYHFTFRILQFDI